MAAFEYTRPTPGARSFGGAALNAVFNLYATLASWNDERVTRKTLSALSDHELDDLGLCRGDIQEISRKNFRR